MILLGIDPSLTATGLTRLDVSESNAHRPQVVGSMVVRSTTALPLDVRLQIIMAKVQDMAAGADRVIIENPTTYKNRWPTALRKPSSVGKLGAAFGAAVVGAGVNITLVPMDWIPVDIKHAVFREVLKANNPCLRGLPDDCVFAGGVALWWLDQQNQTENQRRLAALRG